MGSRNNKDMLYVAPDHGGHHATAETSDIHRSASVEYKGEHFAGRSGQVLREVVLLARQVFAGLREEQRPMTPERVKAIREQLGVSQTDLGNLLRLGANGKRTVARWEAGDTQVSGPVSVALEALENGWRPGDGRWHETRQAFLTVLDAIEKAVHEARDQVQAVGTRSDEGGDQS